MRCENPLKILSKTYRQQSVPKICLAVRNCFGHKPVCCGPRRTTMRPIVNFLQSITFHLHTDTNHLAHPGRYADYAPAWHFEFNLLPQADDGDPFAGLT